MRTLLSRVSVALLLLTVTPGQFAHVAVLSGNEVEKRGLAAVGVARQCDVKL